MRTALLITLCLWCCRQPCAAQYDAWIEKAVAATDKGLHLEAAWAYSKAFTYGPGSDDPWTDRYGAALAWAQAARPDSAIGQLWYLARHTGYGEFAEVELEPVFASLHATKDWNPLLAQLRWNRHISEPVTDTALADRLARILVLDQRHRRAFERFPHDGRSETPEVRGLIEAMQRSDSVNVRYVDSLLRQRGWPTMKQIGRRGVGTVFIVLQHADSSTQARYHTMLRDATAAGNLSVQDFAMFEDRLALRRGQEQLYGTQVVFSDGKWQVDRLADPLHVDERRKAVGLEPLAEYVRDWDIDWDAGAYEKARKAAQSE